MELDGRSDDEAEDREDRKKVRTWWMELQRVGRKEGQGLEDDEGEGVGNR